MTAVEPIRLPRGWTKRWIAPSIARSTKPSVDVSPGRDLSARLLGRGTDLHGQNNTYTFTIAAGTDDSVHVQLQFERVAVHPREREEWQRYADFTAKRARQWGQKMSYPSVPEFKPAYHSIQVGE